MKLTSRKSGPLSGAARIPGDKSMSHRALILGGLTKEETIISGLLRGEDVMNTAAAMRAFGASISDGKDSLWRIHGVGTGHLQNPAGPLDCGNSGTSARLLLGLAAGHPITASFTGDASLSKRPMKRVIEPLSLMGATFESNDGKLPVTIHGAAKTKAIKYRLPVPSAQVKSAILLAGLNAQGRTTVIEATPTRDHSENMLRHFGAKIEIEKLADGAEAIHLDGPQELMGCAVNIPADPSSAAFAIVAALIVEGSEIRLPRVGINPRRTGLYKTLQEMGAHIEVKNIRTEAGEKTGDLIVRGTGLLKGVTVPAERAASMIDEYPALAVAAACADGVTRMEGLSELRMKESDRLEMIAAGLRACGVAVETGANWLAVHGHGRPPKGGATIATAFDHRIAMSFLVLGMATDEPVAIDDGSPINTSFPGFAELMNGLGAKIS